MTFDPQLLAEIGIYFYFPENRIVEEGDNYTTMAIVDGLNELGIPCYSNVAHPQLAQKPLRAASSHVVVFDITSANYSPLLMKGIADFQSRAKLIHSRSDETPVMITPDGVTCVMTHENRFSPFRQNRHPWAFGLSRTRIARHANSTPFSLRRPVIVRNFRPSYGQSVRDSLDLALLPWLEKHFTIDNAISVDDYPHKLATSVGCLAYCGTFASELTKNPAYAANPSFVELAQNRTLLRDTVVIRWDSWRFWESLASGCLTFHLDFEHYGFALPELPVAWKHYIPIRLDDPKSTVTELLDRRPEWESIATAGRIWALEHYAPQPTARRFADLCRMDMAIQSVAA